MPLHIRRANRADIPNIARVGVAAFPLSTDAVAKNLFPDRLRPTDKPDGYAHLTWRVHHKSRKLDAADSVLLVAVDDTLPTDESIVGYAVWDSPGEHKPLGESTLALDPEELATVQAAMDAEALAFLKKAVGDGAKELFGEQGCGSAWHLDYVAVDPRHRRRGIGKLLLDWGMDKAANEGRDCFLVATPAGKPLYVASGFEQVGELDLFGVPHFNMLIKNDARWVSK